MRRPPAAARIELRAWVLPALQAVFTGCSTVLGVILVVLWRPHRPRFIPFYSDATHNDPERIVLAIGENLACFFMPLVAVVEYIQQARLAQIYPRPTLPRVLRCLVISRDRVSTRLIVGANFIVTMSTTLFFFITANVPSKIPYTPPHQVAASALILVYAVQATLKAVLAQTFANYNYSTDELEDLEATVETHRAFSNDQAEESLLIRTRNDGKTGKERTGNETWWDRHHMKLRLLLATALWLSLLATWMCFLGRLAIKSWGHNYEATRQLLSVAMAVIVHVATVSCLILMTVMAVDLRQERIVLFGRTA